MSYPLKREQSMQREVYSPERDELERQIDNLELVSEWRGALADLVGLSLLVVLFASSALVVTAVLGGG